jgi:SAM-dependent methyltransferase
MSTVAAFYDDHARNKFVSNYVVGNRRVERQYAFLAAAIPRVTKRVLVVGCGSGEVVHRIATVISPGAEVMGIDISTAYIEIARELYRHPRTRYEQRDVIEEGILENWDFIVLPDVYEHIPVEARKSLHEKLGLALGPHGRLIITCPSPFHQQDLYDRKSGLQIVDEIVTLSDLISMADDVGGSLTYFAIISVFRINDYIHAIIERDAGGCRPLDDGQRLGVKGWPVNPSWFATWRALAKRGPWRKMRQYWRRRRLAKLAALR